MSGPAYDIVLLAHILAGLVGFGAIAVAGLAASAGRRSSDPVRDEVVLRFFKGGRDWPARAILLVPVLGLALLFGGDRVEAGAPWPWVGLSLWVAATALASAGCWPAERRAQEALAGLVAGDPERRGRLGEFRQACRSLERAAGAVTICFLAAVVVMILQP